jgi:hypothetical protein
MIREFAEMAYQFEQPRTLDTSRYETTFGHGGNALATAVAETLTWYRIRAGAT